MKKSDYDIELIKTALRALIFADRERARACRDTPVGVFKAKTYNARADRTQELLERI
jgi:hypothetical protein